MSQVTVFSGAERRRRWSLEEKRALVEAAFAPGAVVADVARRADLQAGQIYRWRDELRSRGGSPGAAFAEVVVGSAPPRAEPSEAGLIIVELGGGVTVRIGAAAPASLVATTLLALSE